MKKFALLVAAVASVTANQALGAITFSTFTPNNTPGFIGVVVSGTIDGVQNITSFDGDFQATTVFAQYDPVFPATPNVITDVSDFGFLVAGVDADPRDTTDDTHFLVDFSAAVAAPIDNESTTNLEAIVGGLNGGTLTGAGPNLDIAQILIPVGGSFDYEIILVNPQSTEFTFTGRYTDGPAVVIPEPASMLVFAGLAGVVALRRAR